MANDNESINLSIAQLDAAFSGRREERGFDSTKRYQIHRRNRAYVWNAKDKLKLLNSILSGRYIPPIITVETIENNQITRYVVDGGHRITTFRYILQDQVRRLTPEEREIVQRYQIGVVVLRGLTSAQIRDQFRVLQGGKAVSSGQLYAMSDECPLVFTAWRLLYDPAYPLRDMISRNFFDTVNSKDSATQKNLENAVALVSGAMHGVNYITALFDKQEEVLSLPIDETRVNAFLRKVFEIFDMASEIEEQPDGRCRKGQWTLGNYLGAIMYDLHTNPTREREVQEKWRDFLVLIRRRDMIALQVLEVDSARNINETKLQKLIIRLNAYMREGRILSRDEVTARLRVDEAASTDDEEEEN